MTLHRAGRRPLSAQRQGGQQVGPDVEGKHLKHGQQQWDPAAGERPLDEGSELRDVVREVVGEEVPRVVEGASTFLDGLDDVREVVIEQDQVGSFPRDIGARDAHRDTDVGLPKCRGVVHTVARHRDDVAGSLQGRRDPQFLLWIDPREDAETDIGQGVAKLVIVLWKC